MGEEEVTRPNDALEAGRHGTVHLLYFYLFVHLKNKLKIPLFLLWDCMSGP